MKKSGKRAERKLKKGVSRKTLALIGGLVICALAAIIAVNVMFRITINRYDPDIIINGVWIGDTDVSGMTRQEAYEAVTRDTAGSAQEAVTVKLDSERKAEVTLSELGMLPKDLEKIVDSAADYGKKGNPAACYKILKNAEENKNKKVFPVEYKITEDSAGSVLEEKLTGLLTQPSDARLTQGKSGTELIADVPGEALNIKKTVENINARIGEGWDKKAFDVEAAVTETQADITREDLEDITDVLGTFTTYYGSSDGGRTMNVESGAGHINGTLMQPGEEVSADDLMAPYTEENGYAMAASYENNEVVQSMGGGICQVSTTLYNALLLAELEITERYEHSMLVSYVEPSMDAAIADDVKDLKFRNNLQDPVYIEAVLLDGNITFNIYGKETRTAERTVEYVSETLETTESDETRYVATEDAIGTMYTQNEGQTGLKAQLWKVVYENGTEVSREAVNYSTYLASGKTIAVGTFSDNEEDSAKINAAIETQDEKQINAAIQEITGEKEE